jgi:FHS family glucose/mannose:H+ symporter-like MFS transporter
VTAPSRTQTSSTLVPVAAFIVTGMVTTLLGPILPELLERWRLTDSGAGALFTAQFSGSLVAGALSGVLVSRLGDRRTLAIGYGTMSVGLLAIAAGAYALGVVGALAAGVGMGCVIPPTNLLVARGHPDRAASALGALNLSWGIGAAVWPLIVSVAVRFGAMRAALVALALLCAAVSATALGLVPDADALETRGESRTPAPAVRAALFGVLIWLYSGTEMALGGWLPELARRLPVAASPVGSAAVGAMFWGGLSIGRGLISVRLDRRYEDPSVFAGLALTSCSLVLLLTARGDAVVLATAALSGIGLGPIFPVTVASVSREIPVRVAGPLLALGSLGGATVPWVVGSISDLSQSLATGVASLLAALGILAVLHVRRIRGGHGAR